MSEDNSGAVSESLTEEPKPKVEEVPEGTETTENAPENTPEGEETPEGEKIEAQDEGEAGEEPEPEDEPEDKPKRRNKPGRAERQINRLMRQNEALMQQVTALMLRQEGGTTPPGQDQQQTAERPRQEDFTDYADYLRADAEWVAEQKVEERFRALTEQQQKGQQRQRAAAIQSQYEQRVDDARAKYDDFDDVAFSDDVPITETMLNALMDSENGADVQYYLGRNPEEAARITRLSPLNQVMALGKLEQKLSQPKPRKQTAAPPPPKTLTGGGSPEKDPGKMTQAEYEAWRQKAS